MTQDKFSFPIDFQTNIISYLIKDNNTFRKLKKYIKPSYFTEYQLRDIVKISLDFFEKYEEVPNKTSMFNELNTVCLNGSKGLEDYQDFINNVYTFSYNEDYVSDKLINFIKIQSVFNGLKRAYDNMDNGEMVLSIIEEAVKVGNNINFDGGYNYKEKIIERMEHIEKDIRTDNQVPIMMLDIDRITRGGLGAGELGVVIGKPGAGKSIFLCNIAVGACMTGKNVCYFTMEASEDILAGRIDGRISSYTLEEMRQRKDKLLTAVERLQGNLVIKEFPTGVTTPLDLSNYINDMIMNGFIPDLVIVDYIGIMSPTKKCKEIRHAIATVAKEIIAYIGKKYRVPVWSAHQSSDVEEDNNINKLDNKTNKENPNKVIGISGIAEAKVALAAEVDLLLSMNQNAAEKAMYPQGLRIYVPKNRLGPEKEIFHMTIDKKRFIIAETPIVNLQTFC